MEKNIGEFEMFIIGCAFSNCADICQAEQEKNIDKSIFCTSPAIVNAAFACEVFLKLLLYLNKKDFKKQHGLKSLFDDLPINVKEYIKGYVIEKQGRWCDAFGIELLEKEDKAFNSWRYNYESDLSKSRTMYADIGFLFAFKDALKSESRILLKPREFPNWIDD